MNSSVSYERQGEIALITLNNPPVNALGQAAREGLLRALHQGQIDTQAKVLVLLLAAAACWYSVRPHSMTAFWSLSVAPAVRRVLPSPKMSSSVARRGAKVIWFM